MVRLAWRDKFNGPSWCKICKQVDESKDHIIMACPFTKWVWEELESMIGIRNVWEHKDIRESFK